MNQSLARLAAAASLTTGLAVAMTGPAQADAGAVAKSGTRSMTST